MADVEFSVTLDGEHVALAAIEKVARNLKIALTEIERNLTGETHANWVAGEHAVLRATASPNGATEATLLEVIHEAREGFEYHRRGLPSEAVERIRLPAKAQRAIREIVAIVEDVDSITVNAGTDPPVRIDRSGARLPFLPSPVAMIDRSFVEFSSIEGVLDIISVRGNPKFSIKDQASQRPVRCTFPSEMFDEVKSALGRVVTVDGLVKYRPDGSPVSISEVASLKVHTHKNTPIAELRGSAPNLTGGLPAGEFIRRVREDEQRQ